MIDISGLDKVVLLFELVDRARPVGLGVFAGQSGGVTLLTECQAILSSAPHPTRGHRFDYINGRPIKVSFVGDFLHREDLYDRDHGKGACQAVVDALRRRQAGGPARHEATITTDNPDRPGDLKPPTTRAYEEDKLQPGSRGFYIARANLFEVIVRDLAGEPCSIGQLAGGYVRSGSPCTDGARAVSCLPCRARAALVGKP